MISLSSYARFKKNNRIIHAMVVVQTLMLIAFAGILLSRARTFGSNPECNETITVVILFISIHDFRVSLRILIALIVAFGGLFVYLLVCDYRHIILKQILGMDLPHRKSWRDSKVALLGCSKTREVPMGYEEREDNLNVMLIVRAPHLSSHKKHSVTSYP